MRRAVETLKGLIIWNNLFEPATAFVWFITALSWLVDPETTAAHSPVAGGSYIVFHYYWASLYVIAAPMIWMGVARKKPAYRMAGLILLGTGLVMNGVAALSGTLEPRDLNYFVFAAACFFRVYDLFRCKTGRYKGQC
jgi:threonine/homoserine/homoserine lactone efflux protein